MKKVFLILCTIFMLTLFIISASADGLDEGVNTECILHPIEKGVYEVVDNDANVIDIVITDDFIVLLDDEYFLYDTSEDKKTMNFHRFLFEKGYSFMNYNEVAEYVTLYTYKRIVTDIYSNYANYEVSNNSASLDGFINYIRENNQTLFDHYSGYLHSFASSVYALGASSSSSGGSSGSIVPGDKGEHYGQSHGCDAPLDSSGACCYNPGYNDGILDGADEFKESNEYQETINNSKTEAVEQFKQSIEYKETLESIRVEADEYAVDNYLKSGEYEATKDSCFIAGSEAGYTNAYSDLCSDVYYRGVADGHSSFRGSNEHIADMDSSYRMGYDEGVKNERKNGVNPGAVIALMIILFILLAVLISLFQIKKKKRK